MAYSSSDYIMFQHRNVDAEGTGSEYQQYTSIHDLKVVTDEMLAF